MATVGVGGARAGAACLMMLLVGCGGEDTPTDPLVNGGMLSGRVGTQSVSQGASEAPLLAAWITDPESLPVGLRGQNNCTFAFGVDIPNAQWDFHPEGGCWERPGPDGWTRQQQHHVHVPQHARCGGGAGDVSPIRVCRPGGAGQPNPCLENPTTGPTGCAICVRSLACH